MSEVPLYTEEERDTVRHAPPGSRRRVNMANLRQSRPDSGTSKTVRANVTHLRQSERIWHISDSQSEYGTSKTVTARFWP